MDSRRHLPPNGSCAMVNGAPFNTTCLPSAKTSPHDYQHRRHCSRGTGSLYTMCGSDAQVLMNTHTIVAATSLQFLPPIRTKSTLCNVSNMNITTLDSEKMHLHEMGGKLPSTLLLSTMISSTANTITSQMFSGGTVATNNSNSKLFSENIYGHTEGNSLVNAIKSFFNYLIRPIIESTATVMRAENKYSTNSPSSTIQNNNIGNNGFKSESSERSSIYMNFMPDIDNLTFFDCDDYIEGGEDMVDFVADSTKMQRYNSFENLVADAIPMPSPSPNENIFYDCISQSPAENKSVDSKVERSPREDELKEKISCCDNVKDIPKKLAGSIVAENIKTKVVASSENKIPKKCIKTLNTSKTKAQTGLHMQNICGKNEKTNQTKNRKNKRNTNANKIVNRHKGTVSNKNRQEKSRHELEMNIHDDIEDCENAVLLSRRWDDDDDDDDDESPQTDLEIIDADKTPLLLATSSDSSADTIFVENPTRLSEKKRSGCMFTCFINFDMPNIVHKVRSAPRALQKRWHTRQTLHDRPVHRRISETESEDSFVIFDENSPKTTPSIRPMLFDKASCSTTKPIDDSLLPHSALRKTYSRQRQISECSDDFICFEYGADDDPKRYGLRYEDDEDETDEEDLTDSTDDSDSSCESDDSSDSDSGSEIEHDCSSTSGFEEKKVTFNLCPTVHEIRAWKYAYREARKGQWEQIGRDRERFEKRVKQLDFTISPILAHDHRHKIYMERFREPSPELLQQQQAISKVADEKNDKLLRNSSG